MTARPAQAARTALVLAALTAALPVELAATAVGLARARRRRGPAVAPTGRTVLISGGKMSKALQLARAFHAAGHRVVLVESARYRLTGHRFSRAVDRFHVVPDAGADDFAAALRDIVRREGVDVFVPVSSPASSVPEARARRELDGLCEVLHVDPDVVERLDDKHAFAATAAALGLPVPETHRVTDPEQVLGLPLRPGVRYVLKSIPYDPVNRLDLTPLPRPTEAETAAFVRSKPISEEQPWIVQELLEGEEWCTHGTVRSGELTVHCCCPSSPFQVNYAHVDKPAVEAWVRTFVSALDLTGQVSFDFIEGADGVVRAIECNPRTHSAVTTFHDHPDLAAAYLRAGATLTPRPGSRPTYWLAHELWRLLSRQRRLPEGLRVLARGTDAVWDGSDPLPFLALHHLHIPSLLLRDLWQGRDWVRIDFNIGKLVAPAGD
ncbi:hypothetical protein PO878_16460 [Iamia majanohamensis]|uniref:ATP-grasp enzyme n=1 Tax=Iamia majanohamensis TaxID=467976 RepID=A0AAE9Y4E7_9ACTN|nr:hypothetical protein [Iamia majanohamensis]WCO66094.1 hypothetical protein PO878_16460 [Iamia majanohamensis]